MKNRILITGGTGFIGSNLTNLLLKEGYKLNIFDNNFRGKLNRISKKYNKNFKFYYGDIRDKKQLSKSFNDVSKIIHLAYINGTKHFYERPEQVLDVAVKGLINIFDLAIKNKIKEIYLASSSEVYQTPMKIPTPENELLKVPDIFNPRYCYGTGKILTEVYGSNFGKKYFKKMIIFRPHNVYGKDMGNDHVIPELIEKFKKIKNNKIIKIQGSGNEKRSFIHIDDFCNSFLNIIKKGKHLNIYNIGTSEIVTIKNIIKKLEKIFNIKVKIVPGKLKKGGTLIRCPDIRKIKKIGFKPKITLKRGLEKIILED
tara:strand:+ start:4190 stop:5128 length:939 start_codon:yes stop_codon:yes gene_type:complete